MPPRCIVLEGLQINANDILIGQWNVPVVASSEAGSLLVRGLGSNVTMSERRLSSNIGKFLMGQGVTRILFLGRCSPSTYPVPSICPHYTGGNNSGTLDISSGAEFETQGLMAVNGAMNVETGGVVNSG